MFLFFLAEVADSHKTVSETVGPIRGGKLIFTDFNHFCVMLINFLPIIKQVRQFLKKGKLFLGEGERERYMLPHARF